MSDYLDSLVGRIMGVAPVVLPRLPGRFEPGGPAVALPAPDLDHFDQSIEAPAAHASPDAYATPVAAAPQPAADQPTLYQPPGEIPVASAYAPPAQAYAAPAEPTAPPLATPLERIVERRAPAPSQAAAPAPAPGVPAEPAARLGGAAPLERIVERLTEQTAAPAPAPGVPAQPAARLGGAAPLERIVERLTEQTAARVASQRLDPPGEQLAPATPATIVRQVRVAPQPAAPAAPLIEHAAEPIGAPVVPPGPAQPGALAEHVAAGRAPVLTPIQHIVERMRQHEVAIVAAPAPMPAEAAMPAGARRAADTAGSALAVPPAPTVQVTIGRIEVRAAPAPAQATRRAAAPLLSLDEYLRQRSGGAR